MICRPTTVLPVKATLSMSMVGGDGGAGDLAEAGEDVDDTGWEASLFDELGGVEGAERGLLGGLEDDDVAAGDGGADLPGPHEEGEVPGDDLAADTDLERTQVQSASGNFTKSHTRCHGCSREIEG